MPQFYMSDTAYFYLGSMIDHPYRRRPVQMYTGFGMARPSESYQTFKGLAAHLNAFAKMQQHPSTYKDMRDPYRIENDPAFKPTQRPNQPNATPTKYATLPSPLALNWINYTPTHEESNADPLYNVDGPCCILSSPYNLELYGDWMCDDIETLKYRDLALDSRCIEYFSRVAVWWRIPTWSYLFSSAADPNVGRRGKTKSMHNTRTAMVLEVIGSQLLSHPMLQPLPEDQHRKPNDYKYQRILPLHDACGNRIK